MSIQTGFSVLSKPALVQPGTTDLMGSAPGVGGTVLHDVQSRMPTAEIESKLTGRARSNGVSKQKAAQQIESKNISVGPSIRQNTTAPLKPDVMKPQLASTTKPKSEKELFKIEITNLMNFLKREIDKETKASLSPFVYFKKGSDGQLVMLKIPEQQDSSKSQQDYMKSSGGAEGRELAAEKLKAIFAKAGIDIHPDLKNALPGKQNAGNIPVIVNYLADAELKMGQAVKNEKSKIPSTKSEVIAEFESELSSLNWNDIKEAGSLFRENSDSSRRLAGYLESSLTGQIKSLSSTMISAAQSAMTQHKSLDKALLAGHQAMLNGLSKLDFPPEFNDIAFALTDLINDIASKKSNANNHSQIGEMANKAKELLPATILLRVFCPDLSDQLAVADRQLSRDAMKVLGKAPGKEETLYRIGDKLQKLFNGQMFMEDKLQPQITLLKPGAPEYAAFVADPAKNSIENFKALARLKQDIGKR